MMKKKGDSISMLIRKINYLSCILVVFFIFGLNAEGEKKEISLDVVTKSVSLPDNSEKVTLYSNIRNLDMAGSGGNIILYSTAGDKFSVHTTEALNLTLENASSLRLKNETVTLKSGDIINIVGKNNVIEVANVFNFNGSLLFDADSQLTIKLTTDDAKVIFASNSVLDLESNVEFKVSGYGIVELGDNSIINLKGATASPTLYPSFIIDDFATFEPADNSTNLIKGVGKIIAQSGGVIDVRGYAANRYLNVGDSTTDDIDFYVRGKGMIRLDGGVEPYRSTNSFAPPTGNYGNLSFRKGKYSLTVKQGGIIYIGPGGWLEFNSILAEPSGSGHLKKMDFGPDGKFCLSTGGLLSFADNDFVRTSQLTSEWIADDTVVFGDNGGQVEYIARDPRTGFQYQGFIGTFNASGFKFKNTDGIIPKNIVTALIN